MLADYPSRGGKMLRPAICLANAALFGNEAPAAAVRAAAAIEMLHNALLIHDDVQDGSELRRGKPTLHALPRRAAGDQRRGRAALCLLRPADRCRDARSATA
jgi:geranylgeranyl diphosphate synthase type II